MSEEEIISGLLEQLQLANQLSIERDINLIVENITSPEMVNELS